MLIPLTSEQTRWVDATLNTMTLPQAAGQLLCPTAPWFSTDDWLAVLEKIPIGSLTARGISTPDLRNQMQALQEKSAVPLLVAGDLEHGAIALTDGTEFPWMMGAGAANDGELMRTMGQATAAEARYAGMHWTFAPVIDLNYNFNNPITNIRALSDQPERVIRLATAYVSGLQADSRIAATAKHFPGDGMDDRDQHLCTTVNNLPFDQWQATYGRVWQAVIDAGVMCIMPGHISLPDYQGFADNPEAAPPATLSAKLLVDLLRTEMGYDGLLVSDASPMMGLVTRVADDERAVQCINAGLDVYLFADPIADHAHLLDAVKDGRLSEARVWAAARRVLEMKARLNVHRDPFGPKPAAGDITDYQNAAQTMADKSITVLRSDGRPPLKLASGSRVLTVTIGQLSPFNKFMPQVDLAAFDDELRQRGFEVEHLLNPDDEQLLAQAATADIVFLNLLALPYMVLGCIRNIVGHLGNWAWRGIATQQPHVAVTSFGNPYVLHEMPSLPNLLAAYGDSEVSQRAAVKVWLGEIDPEGDCPVSLPTITIKPFANLQSP